MARRTFHAMGTNVELLLDAPPTADVLGALRDAERVLRRLAAMLTRFDATSELRRLERDRARRCAPELVEVIGLALDARRRTRGCFDPTILPALRAAGYDRTFNDVQRSPNPSSAPPAAARGVHVDAATGIVALADGVALDLGGIAKGWIADQVAELLAETAPALVDAGGDIACTARPTGEPWTIDVAGSDLRIELRAGGVATSGIDRRRWIDPASGAERHHVIDPRTGEPTNSDLARVTTVANSCVVAEVASTALLVAGGNRALEVTAGCAAAWRAERRDGTILASRELR